MKILETERLILRTWQESDVEAYWHINQDPKVIEYLRGALTYDEVRDFLNAMNCQQQEKNFTLWAAEEKASGACIGFIGLNDVAWQAHFTPAVEVGWRLNALYWGKGLATEGAKAALTYGFAQMGLSQIVAFTVPKNVRSIRVMEKLGMQRDVHGDFLHPMLTPSHPLAPHILYRICNASPT